MSEYTDTEHVRRDLHRLVADLDQAGEQAEPVVFGTGHPQAVLISAQLWRRVAEVLDDLDDAALVRGREQGVDVHDLPTQSVEDLADELGLNSTGQERP